MKQKRNNAKKAIFIFIMTFSLFVTTLVKWNNVHAEENEEITKSITITKETVNDETGEFTFRIKATKFTPEIGYSLIGWHEEEGVDSPGGSSWYFEFAYGIEPYTIIIDGVEIENYEGVYLNGMFYTEVEEIVKRYEKTLVYSVDYVATYELDPFGPVDLYTTNKKLTYQGKEYDIFRIVVHDGPIERSDDDFFTVKDHYYYWYSTLADNPYYPVNVDEIPNYIWDAKVAQYGRSDYLYILTEGIRINEVEEDFIKISDEKTEYYDFSSQGATLVDGEESVYEFTLKNGESKVFNEIPLGYEYEVWEETPEGWTLVSIDGVEGEIKASGTIEENNECVHTFVNEKEKMTDYGVEYRYEGDLPKEVLETLPNDANRYLPNTTVQAKDPSAIEIPVPDGKWVFIGWDKQEDTIIDADILFIGKWEFVKKDEPVPPTEEPTPPSPTLSLSVEPESSSAPTPIKVNKTNRVTVPNTSDNTNMLKYSIAFLFSLVMGIGSFSIKKRLSK